MNGIGLLIILPTGTKWIKDYKNICKKTFIINNASTFFFVGYFLCRQPSECLMRLRLVFSRLLISFNAEITNRKKSQIEIPWRLLIECKSRIPAQNAN